MDEPYLPQEIITQIFSKLPTKSVGKLRCLSKSWCNRLSSSQFINLHVISRKTHQPNLFLFPLERNDFHIITPPVQNYDLFSKKCGPIDEWQSLLGSCNGLILLESEFEELTLLNPITREESFVPVSPIQNQGLRNRNGKLLTNNDFMYGLGYDSYRDDYKVVQVVHCYGINNVRQNVVHVYSVKLGSWKRWNGAFPPNDVNFLDGIFLNRALHWLSSRSFRGSGNPCVITTFDLTDEVFREIPGPRVSTNNISLFVVGERLCVVEIVSRVRQIVWLMREYGSLEPWDWFIVDSRENWTIRKPLCFLGREGIVLITNANIMVVCNVWNRAIRDMMVDGALAHFWDGSTFVESLVSPAPIIARLNKMDEALGSTLMTRTLVAFQNSSDPGRLVLKQSIWLMDCLRSCWMDDLLVLSQFDMFVHLFGRFVSRYLSWLSSGLDARKAGNENPSHGTEWAISATPDDFLYVIHDLECLVNEIYGVYLDHVNIRRCHVEVIALMKQRMLQFCSSLKYIRHVVVSVIIETLVQKSVEDLGQLKEIATMWTNKPLHAQHLPYVSGLLQPLKDFLAGERAAKYLTNELRKELLKNVACKITIRYNEVAVGLVNAARSIKSLFQGIHLDAQREAKTWSNAPEYNMPDVAKICMQLFLDIQEYGRDFNIADIPAYISMWQFVCPFRKA